MTDRELLDAEDIRTLVRRTIEEQFGEGGPLTHAVDRALTDALAVNLASFRPRALVALGREVLELTSRQRLHTPARRYPEIARLREADRP